jgi:hypothetical protein
MNTGIINVETLLKSGEWVRVERDYATEFQLFKEVGMKERRTIWLRVYSHYSTVWMNENTFLKSISTFEDLEKTIKFFSEPEIEEEKVNDPVNRPAHYTDGKIEVIDFIEDKKLGFHLGNAVKYIARAGKKDPLKFKEDLEKAVFYIHRHIETQL